MNLYILNEIRRGALYGVGTYIHELSTALKDSCWSVCVINLMSDKQQMQVDEIDGVHYWHFPSAVVEQRTIGIEKREELYYRNIVYLLQLYIEDKKDLIFHLNYNHFNKLFEELKKSFNCKIIITIHYIEWCFKLFGNVSNFRHILTLQEISQINELQKIVIKLYKKEKEFFLKADHIICLSENTLQILQDDYQIPSSKVSIIYNGLSDCNLVTDKSVLRQKYLIPDVPVILFAGRLDDIKGLRYALKAFKIVLSKYPHCYFIITGNGEFDIFMKECEDIWTHVIWTGFLDKNKLNDLYSIADIGIIPSFHEQCNYVAIEMMMHGLPMITTSSPGLDEMTEDGISSLQIPLITHSDNVEINTDLLADTMLYLLEHPDVRKRIGANARLRYEAAYSAEIFRKNMLNFYASLL